MTIPTQMSLHGLIATDPQLHFSENGVARFNARVGVPQFRQDPDGSTTELEPTFHDLVIFRKTAERAYEAFRKATPSWPRATLTRIRTSGTAGGSCTRS